MPQFSDDLFLGIAVGANPSGDGNPSPMPMGVGPLGRVYIWDVVPATLLANGVALSQNPASGAAFSLTAGAGTTSRIGSNGTLEVILDVPRSVTITAAGANTAIYRVEGYDQYGQPMSQLLAAPSTSTVATTKAFKVVSRVINTNATAGLNGLTVGFNDKLGLPVRLSDIGYVLSQKWAGVATQDAGTLVAADATSPATVSTTDVRGSYTPSSAANGARRLIMAIAVPGIAAGPNATRVGAFGVTQV